MRTPEQDRIYIETRLPNKPWVTVPEISCAFCVSKNTVVAYIDRGRIGNVRNRGAGGKRYFEAWREDVVTFWISMRFNG